MARPDRYRIKGGIALNSAQQILLGYVAIALAGGVVLAAIENGWNAFADHFFTSVSAVSTTGLTTLPIGATYSPAGEIAILALIQLGGIGYMTIAALLVTGGRHHTHDDPEKAEKTDFALPPAANVRQFAGVACIMAFVVEAAGAIALYPAFAARGVEDAAWNAVFLSVSAFCTSGLDLFGDSLAGHAGAGAVLLPVSVLSLSGAIGFLFAWDLWRSARERRLRLLYTNKVVLVIFTATLALSTLALFLFDARFSGLATGERLLGAFFAAMSSSTTAGFHTHDTAALAPPALLVVAVTMVIGASPSGTSGGIKTTTIALLVAATWAALAQKERARLFGHTVSAGKVRAAAATLVFYIGLALTATLALVLMEPEFGLVAGGFEALSALGTVGLSFGITPDLGGWGKALVIVLMIAGRVGVLAFGAALASGGEDESGLEDAEKVE